MALLIFLDTSNNFYFHSLLNTFQTFLVIHKHETQFFFFFFLIYLFIYQLEANYQGCEDEKAPSPSSLGYLLGQKKHQVVGASRLVTQWVVVQAIAYPVARQFLLAQRGAFSFPLIGFLFLARHMLIGQLQEA